MREILFCGKRIDNGEWVWGFLTFDGVNEVYYIYDSEVDPSTVGQYTGLKDKNGKRIFEGDILSLRTGRQHVVMFEDGAFVLENTAISIRFANKFDVIGNIHENPDLMGGAWNG